MLDQGRNVVQMLYKCFVFAGIDPLANKTKLYQPNVHVATRLTNNFCVCSMLDFRPTR